MAWVIGFAMVLARLAGFFIAGPIFGHAVIPVVVRSAVAVVLAVFFSSFIPLPVGIARLGQAELAFLLALEVMYGLLLGILVQMIFAAVRFAGQIIEQQMGLTTAEMVDPLTGQEKEPAAEMLEVIFLLLLLAGNGHHLLIGALLRSFQDFPIGHVPGLGVMTLAVVKAGSALLLMGLRVAGPILVAFLLLYVVLAIFARVVPEMDILLLTFPARIGLGLVMTWLLVPVLQELAGQLGTWMARLLPM